MYMYEIRGLISRIQELETLLDQSDRKSDILTNLLIEANAEFERALEQATESEANMRAVFENAPEAIYLIDTETWEFFYCNPYTIRWLGYDEPEILSMRVSDILETGSQGVRENVQRAIDQGLVRIQERRFRKKDGTLVDAEITGTIVEIHKRKYMVGFVRDITERKQIEELTRYKELFENVGDPVFINDIDGYLLEANDVACHCLGYDRESLLGRCLQEFVGPQSWRKLRSMEEGIKRSGRIQLELEILTKNNEMVPFELHARAITFRGRPAALSVARDLSIRKQMEQALIKSARLSAVGEMASGVAHNFNNFLQMIMSAGEAAMSKLEAGKISEVGQIIGDILEASRRGADIVRRIREFRDVRPDDLDGTEIFDLGELIEEAVNLTRPLWQNLPDSRKYRVNVVKGEGCYVRGKSSALYEVLVNLIKNAIEAMPKGGLLAICSFIQDRDVYLKVSDSGLGISPDDCQRIFEPFFTTKGLKNSGLGLASSYGIIKKHQGKLLVDSTRGQGTTFTIVLPLVDVCILEQNAPDGGPGKGKNPFPGHRRRSEYSQGHEVVFRGFRRGHRYGQHGPGRPGSVVTDPF